MDKLFSPSFHEVGHGHGFGPAVSQKFVSEHGGRHSGETAAGQGSLFTLELPATLPGAGPQTTSL